MWKIPLLLASITIAVAASAEPVSVVSGELSGAIQPQVAIAKSGRVHVVYGQGTSILHTSAADGRTFAKPIKVGSLEKLALGMRRGPRIAVSGDRVLATAISPADGMLHAWTSKDSGATWQEAAPINTPPASAREGLHSLADDGKGTVAAVWLDLRDSGMQVWGRASRDAGATWGTEFRVYQSPDGHVCECCVPTVAFSSSGTLAVMWRNWLGGSRDLYLATSRDLGVTFSAAQKLGKETWTLKGCPMDGGGIAFAPSGEWMSVWRREASVFRTQGEAPEEKLASASAQPVIAFAGSTPVTIWQQEGGLMLQRGDAKPVRYAEKATFPSVASAPASAWVAWESMRNGKPELLVDKVEP